MSHDPSVPAPSEKDSPTVLMVGGGEPMDLALHGALERHGVFVDAAEPASVTEAVLAAAPDLVLLVGDSTKDGGAAILKQLASSPATAHAPVAVLAGEWPFARRLDAYRRGAAAVLARDASVDALARRIAELARTALERPGEPLGELGEATLDELVGVVTQSLRGAIAPSGDPAGTRIVLGAGRPVAEALDGFVGRVRSLVGGIEAVHWELGGAPRPRQAIADVDPEEGGDAAVYQGLRVLVVVYDPMRGDALARELRAREAVVALTDAAGRGLETARTLVPEIAIVDAAKVREPSFEILRALRRDPRLRWTSILVALKDEIWAGDSPEPQMRRLAARISPLLDADRTLRERARSESLETRLEVTGPWRLLRALAAAEGTLHVKIQTSQASLELDVGGGLVVGAQGKLADGAPVEGNAALAVFLAAVAGKVTVARRKHPAIANLVTPVELALAGAAKDLPSRPPSSPGFALDLPRTEPTPTTTRRAEPLAAPPRIEEPAPRKSTLVFHPPPPEPAPPAPEAAAPPPVLPVAEPPARARNRSRLVIGAASLGVVFVVVAIAVALAASGPEPAATVGRTAAAPAPASAGSEPATAATGVSAEATADAAPEPESEDVAPGSRMSKRDRAAALLQRAKRLRGSGQTPQAEKLYMQILRFDPRNWRAAEELARIYLARRRGAGAVEWAERAVRQHPGSPSLRVLLGDAYKLAGDNGRAERQWRGALRINPRYRDARQRLGMD